LWRQGDYDVLMLYCELFPLAPAWLERLLMQRPYVYDLDDAFYLRYREGRMRFLRGVLGGKADALIKGAAAVTGGNRVLADYAHVLNPATSCLPTVVDTGRYIPAPRAASGRLTVGWIGSPSTAAYLSLVAEPLARIGREGEVRLVVIGGRAPDVPNVEVVELPWAESTEVGLINTFDVGVMPLTDDPWARGKCAFKLIQYMACGVPVIASPVGANVDVLEGGAGLLATSPNEWADALRMLRDDLVLRADLGARGRARVEDDYSLHHHLPRLASVLRAAADRGR
jgi:glycosyltransferase involved in cell wall biosynthesis